MTKYALSNPQGLLCYYKTDWLEEVGRTILFNSEEEVKDFVLKFEEYIPDTFLIAVVKWPDDEVNWVDGNKFYLVGDELIYKEDQEELWSQQQ